jgi:hypothetical protein
LLDLISLIEASIYLEHHFKQYTGPPETFKKRRDFQKIVLYEDTYLAAHFQDPNALLI